MGKNLRILALCTALVLFVPATLLALLGAFITVAGGHGAASASLYMGRFGAAPGIADQITLGNYLLVGGLKYLLSGGVVALLCLYVIQRIDVDGNLRPSKRI